MSDAHDKLEAALAEYIAERTGGGLVLDYLVVVASATEEDFEQQQTEYSLTAPDGQAFHHAVGLAHRAAMLLEQSSRDG